MSEVWTKMYRGQEIKLDENQYFGWVHEGEVRTKPTYSGIEDDIDAVLNAKEKVARRMLSIPAINRLGRRTTVTGIHAGNGKLLSKPNIDGFRSDDNTLYYSEAPFIEERLKEERELSEKLNALRVRLSGYRVRWEHGEYEGFYRNKLDDYITRLETRHTQILDAAKSAGGDNK